MSRHHLQLLFSASTAHQGFTLIELMIVITLMTLLFGGGVASYRRLERRQSLNNVCNKIKEMALTAQKRARVGDRPTGCTRLNSYRVRLSSASPANVRLEAICSNTTLTIEDYPVHARFALTTFGTMTFKVLQGGLEETTATVLGQTASPNYRCQFTVDGGGSMSQVSVSTY